MSTTTPGNTAKKLMTVDEFWEFSNRPENVERRLELIRGEVVDWPIPYLKHGVVCTQIGVFLEGYSRRMKNGYVVGINAGIILAHEPQSVVGPDISYFLNDELTTGWSKTLPAFWLWKCYPRMRIFT